MLHRPTQRVRERESLCLDKKCRQAPTGPNTSLGALHVGDNRGEKKEVDTRYNEMDWKVHWCQQVSTGGGEKRKRED